MICSAVRATSARLFSWLTSRVSTPGAAFGGLVEQEAVADLARGHRFGEHLPFLKLEHRLDAAQDSHAARWPW